MIIKGFLWVIGSNSWPNIATLLIAFICFSLLLSSLSSFVSLILCSGNGLIILSLIFLIVFQNTSLMEIHLICTFWDFCIICPLWLVGIPSSEIHIYFSFISDICLNVPTCGDILWPPYCHHHLLRFYLALFFMEAVTTVMLVFIYYFLCLFECHLHNGVTFH